MPPFRMVADASPAADIINITIYPANQLGDWVEACGPGGYIYEIVDEIVHVIDGRMRLRAGGRTFECGLGDASLNPRENGLFRSGPLSAIFPPAMPPCHCLLDIGHGMFHNRRLLLRQGRGGARSPR